MRSWHSGGAAIPAQTSLGATLAGVGIYARARIVDLGIGWVEDLRRSYASGDKEAERHSPDFKLAFPYRGLFIWHVGRQNVVGDANQALFVRPGEAFRISSPSSAISGELIVTPDVDVLAEIARTNERNLFGHELFRRRAVRATALVQIASARFLHRSMSHASIECLEAEEALLALMRATFQCDVPPRAGRAATARVVDRAKVVLSERFTHPLRLRDISRAVGVSPAYLTDLFRRIEGISLHRYLVRLRLSRALVELPHANDITALALNLGFSSHSHFTCAFRRAFQCTPSRFRELTRKQVSTYLDTGISAGLTRDRQ